MKALQTLRRLERIMVAVTFAEANEHETALRIMAEPGQQRQHRRKKKTARVQADNRPQLRM
ncbi:MAG: hypothetical protein SWH68_06420 [Thermodesulfobacteriota bacterium]|nr:hypothetical protein [Thermodesulfobacteriota bacterium]